MLTLYRASRSALGWAVIALVTLTPATAYARDWWVIEPDGTCQPPHVYSSPADEIRTLTREGGSVLVKKADFPDGSFALTVSLMGKGNIWVTNQMTCNFLVAMLKPPRLDTDWDDFQ
jgi:hypothetical protein